MPTFAVKYLKSSFTFFYNYFKSLRSSRITSNLSDVYSSIVSKKRLERGATLFMKKFKRKLTFLQDYIEKKAFILKKNLERRFNSLWEHFKSSFSFFKDYL